MQYAWGAAAIAGRVVAERDGYVRKVRSKGQRKLPPKTAERIERYETRVVRAVTPLGPIVMRGTL